MNLSKLQAAAARYRREWGIPDDGYIVFSSGDWSNKLEADGWIKDLTRPQSFIPGRCFALSLDGALWKAVGGNDYDGAISWEQLRPS